VSRRLIALALAAAGGVAHAQPAEPVPEVPPAPEPVPPVPTLPPASPASPASPAAPATPASPAEPAAPASPAEPVAAVAAGDDEMGDQGISAVLGLATGGRVTPGGLRIAGHYLYQLSERDWFDGAASFTFGSGSPACFRDRQDVLVCNHGLADGSGVEVSAGVRRMLAPQAAFHPFVRAGVGLGVVRFGDDDVSGFTLALGGGGGVRVTVAPSIAVVAQVDLALGFGGFSHGLGLEPQLGLIVTVGAEFRLR
jgi:hypothetical protein